jgi:hypothetical protein
MKVKEFMERVGTTKTGRAVAYLKDAMEDMNIYSETHVATEKIDITSGQRFYTLPKTLVKIIDLRVKSHNNGNDAYRSIPRLTFEPKIKDSDGQ